MAKLTGNDARQVPTSAHLGSAAFIDKESLLSSNLGGYSKEITKRLGRQLTNVNSLFVYDTTMDSDGGEWRKRTKNTSWYNEKLNTVTRGKRREFPSRAIIIAEQQRLIIYDGDDPELSMWMIFNTGAQHMIGANDDNISEAKMVNGQLVVGENESYGGLVIIDFIADRARRHRGTNSTNGTNGYAEQIQRRNFIAFDRINNRGYDNIALGTIATDNVKRLDVTVPGDAPINPNNGLPGILIGCCTNTNLNFLLPNNFDGKGSLVKRGESYGASMRTEYIKFTGNGTEYIYGHGWAGNDHDTRMVFVQDGYITNTSNLEYGRSYQSWEYMMTDQLWPSNTGAYINGVASVPSGVSGEAYAGVDRLDTCDKVKNKGIVAAYGNQFGLSLVGDRHKSVAYIGQTMNTGVQYGFQYFTGLSNTVTETINNSINRVTNGDGNSTAGWITVAGTLTTGGGKLIATRSGGSGPVAYQQLSVIPGQYYTVSVRINSPASRADVEVRSSNVVGSGSQLRRLNGSAGNVVRTSSTFKVYTDTVYIWLNVDNDGDNGQYDDIVVRRCDFDHSRYSNGPQYYGDMIKEEVNTGTDLVGYTNFYLASSAQASPDNGMIVPANYNIGSSDYYTVMCWFNMPSNSDYQYICQLYDGENKDNGTGVSFFASSGVPYIWSDQNSTVSFGSRDWCDENWHLMIATWGANFRRVVIDGEQQGSISTVGTSVNFSPVEISIGMHRQTTSTGDQNFRHYTRGSLALLRIAGSSQNNVMPSLEECKQIYELERPLFYPNAKATLGGKELSTSLQTRGLAYDRKTNELHATFDAGRSVFNGLTRTDFIPSTNVNFDRRIAAGSGIIVED